MKTGYYINGIDIADYVDECTFTELLNTPYDTLLDYFVNNVRVDSSYSINSKSLRDTFNSNLIYLAYSHKVPVHWQKPYGGDSDNPHSDLLLNNTNYRNIVNLYQKYTQSGWHPVIGENISCVPRLRFKGYNPIGIPILSDTTNDNNQLGPGTYYFCREGDATYFDTVENGKTFRLRNDAKLLTFELQGAGGAGGETTLVQTANGGGSGAYVLIKVYLTDATKIKLTIGKGGVCNGSNGESTTLRIYNSSGDFEISAGGGTNGEENGKSVGQGGTVSMLGTTTNSGYWSIQVSGVSGGNYNHYGQNSGSVDTTSNSYFSHISINRPSITGGIGQKQGTDDCGGGGGSSVFAQGGSSNKRAAGNPGSMGSGGAGGSYKAFNKVKGGNGGDGLAIVYY